MTLPSPPYVLLIEASSSCLKLLPAIKRLGYRALVFSADKHDRFIPSLYRSYIDKLIVIDTNNRKKVIGVACELNKRYKFKGVIPGSEYHVCIAAYVAKELNLPGHPISKVNALREKDFMRKFFKSTTVRMPRHFVINSHADLVAAIANVGFPAVIKPTAMAGSLNVKKVYNKNELKTAYQDMVQSDIYEMEHGVGNVILLEEYIDGKEYSVEGYLSSGNFYVLSITEKFLGPEPYFVEMGHIVEAHLKNNVRESIINFVKEVVAALKLNIGVFHIELVVDDKGPKLIEIAGRLPGDHICDLIKLAKGSDLPEIMVMSHLDIPIDLTIKLNKCAGIHYFSTNQKYYERIEGIDDVKTLPGFHEYREIISSKEYIKHPETFHGRVAYVIFHGSTYDIVQNSIEHAQRDVKVISRSSLRLNSKL